MEQREKLRITLTEIQEYARALHCPTRWKIIHLLGDGKLSTGEIREQLEGDCLSTGGQNLYYHLSELSSTEIIEVAEYLERGGGAPQKVWQLAIDQINIDLLGGDLSDKCHNSTA
ncbi:MAG: helix-turn-helix domain-containing protein [Candidatus Bipolaricaulota bacterium]